MLLCSYVMFTVLPAPVSGLPVAASRLLGREAELGRGLWGLLVHVTARL